MEEMIETSVSPEVVWSAWEKAHALHGEKAQKSSVKGKFKYKVLDVKQGESFSILWKTLFVRLIFSHSVKPTRRGAKITYRVQIKGLFAWPVRALIGEKIRVNIRSVLKSIVLQLESQLS
jgi:hypothetical protein